MLEVFKFCFRHNGVVCRNFFESASEVADPGGKNFFKSGFEATGFFFRKLSKAVFYALAGKLEHLKIFFSHTGVFCRIFLKMSPRLQTLWVR